MTSTATRLDLKTSACAYGNIEAKLLNNINVDRGSTATGAHARTMTAAVSHFCCEFSMGRLRRLGNPPQR
jgi:hypothetical protein